MGERLGQDTCIQERRQGGGGALAPPMIFFPLSAQRSVMAMIIPLPHYENVCGKILKSGGGGGGMCRSPPPPRKYSNHRIYHTRFHHIGCIVRINYGPYGLLVLVVIFSHR